MTDLFRNCAVEAKLQSVSEVDPAPEVGTNIAIVLAGVRSAIS